MCVTKDIASAQRLITCLQQWYDSSSGYNSKWPQVEQRDFRNEQYHELEHSKCNYTGNHLSVVGNGFVYSMLHCTWKLSDLNQSKAIQ